MCFSASASFMSGTILSVIGVVTLKIATVKKERAFAMIPLLFGIQQLAEGLIWLSFKHEAPVLRQIMTFVYTIFSHVLWPIYVPFSIAIIEEVRWRKKTIMALGGVGVLAGFYLLYFIVTLPVVAEIMGSHIVYILPHFYMIPILIFYVAATCISCFFSSHGFVKLFGACMFISFMIAYFVHVRALVSIWCFFAAILSLLIYSHFRFKDSGQSSGNMEIIPDMSKSFPV